MKLSIKAGSTSQTVNLFVADSSSTTGGGLTGLLFNSPGLTAYYALPRAVPVSITLVTLAAVTTAYTSGGFKEIDATNMPGWYRFDLPDAALASGRFVNLHLKGATNMAPLPIEIELTGWDNQDATRGGLANLDATVSSRNAVAPPTVAQIRTEMDTNSVKLDVAVSTRNAVTPPTVVQIRNDLDTNSVKLSNLDAPMSSRSTYAGADTAGTTTLLARIPGTVQPQTGDSFTRLGTPAGASHAADVAAVKADTGALRTDYTSARAAKLDNLDAAVSTRSTYAGADTPGTGTLLTRIPGTVQPQTGDSYARLGAPAGASHAADVAAVKVDTGGLRTDYTTVRAAKLDNLDATVSSRSTYAGTDTAGVTALLGRIPGVVQPQTGDSFARLGAPAGASLAADVAGVKTDTSGLRTDYTTARAVKLDRLDVAVGSIPDAVWDEPAADHTDPGSTGSDLSDAASGSGGGGGSSDPVAIAKAVLTLDWTTVSGEADRSMLNALRAMRNKVSISDNGDGTGTLTVTKENDTTIAWTAACDFDTNASPIARMDPA